jgi:hypothetical protein
LFREYVIHFWEDQQSKARFSEQIQRFRKWHTISNNSLQKPTMLTLDDFRVMPFERKCDVITFHGNYLMQRVLADCKVFLYFTEGFFIEVFYSPKHQKVLMINAFDNTQGLKPYLDKISLTDLLS